MLLNSADNTLLFRIYSQLIAIFMSLRVMNKVDKMKKDEKKGKRHYTWEEYDEVYDQMPVFIEYEEEEYDEDGYWDLNL